MFYKSNNYDWNTAAVWIALAISIITPTISLIMSNIHQRKLKKLEFLSSEPHNQKRKAISVHIKLSITLTIISFI